MHPNVRAVAELLAAHGASGTVKELPDSARTAADAAAEEDAAEDDADEPADEDPADEDPADEEQA